MCYGDGSSGDAFPTKKLVAEEFEKHKKAIWSWLMSDEASSSLAVYGIWGCGKNNIVHTYLQYSSKTTETFPSCFLDHCKGMQGHSYYSIAWSLSTDALSKDDRSGASFMRRGLEFVQGESWM
ncbi:hypothetical protein Peur_033681 [Populus x canadensis]